MYLFSILHFLSWPVLIWISYRLILFALKRYEKIPQRVENDEPELFIVD